MPSVEAAAFASPRGGILRGFLGLLESPAVAGCPWRTRPGPLSLLSDGRRWAGLRAFCVSHPTAVSPDSSSPSCFHSHPIVRVQAWTSV